MDGVMGMLTAGDMAVTVSLRAVIDTDTSV